MIIVHTNPSKTPQPATARHAEILNEITQRAQRLLQLIEAERKGTYDNLGANFWVQCDPVLQCAQKLATLAQERISVL
jgi:hypothetical protein